MSLSCVVCGDSCEGYHYGVLCCAGCKAFFRRTVRYQVIYACEGGGKCEVSAKMRNACRCCRFKKCIAVDMNPNWYNTDVTVGGDATFEISGWRQQEEGVRQNIRSTLQCDRGRINRKAAVAVKGPGTKQLPALEFNPAGQKKNWQVDGMPAVMSENDYQANEMKMMDMLTSLVGLPVKQFAVAVSANYKFIIDLMVNSHMRTKKTTVAALHGDHYDQLTGFGQADLRTMARHIRAYLAAIVAEAQNCALFSILCPADKISLLRWYAPQGVIITTIAATVAAQGDFVVLADDYHILPRKTKGGSIINNIISELLDDLVPTFRQLKCDPGEYSCIRLLALWNPDYISEPRAKDMARRIQQGTMATLEKHIEARNLQDETTVCHYGNLLMSLKQIQHVAQNLRQCIQVARALKLIDMDNFLDDLFTDPRPIEAKTEVVMQAAIKAFKEEMQLEDAEEYIAQQLELQSNSSHTPQSITPAPSEAGSQAVPSSPFHHHARLPLSVSATTVI